MMWRRLLIVDLVIVAALVAGGLRVRQSWAAFEQSHRVESVRPEKENLLRVPAPTVAAAPQDWTEISVKNPFSFDRNDISIVAPKQAIATTPKPVLFGTMSIGSDKVAMLAPAFSANRTSRPVKVGESLDEWQVVEIRDTSVIVSAANGVRETIILNDPKTQVSRSSERTGGGSASGPAAVSVVNPSTSAPTGPATTSTQAPQTAPPPQSTSGQPTGEILMTPFGPVPRTR
jgi:hypothetical protein